MKFLFISSIIFILISCNQIPVQFGEGGRNACRYVKERLCDQRENINKFEIVKEDSLLDPNVLIINSARRATAGYNFVSDCNNKEVREIFSRSVIEDSIYMLDLQQSWAFDFLNDSLKNLEKYNYRFRKVYTVRVFMKSRVTHDVRVLMERDGITPSKLESDVKCEIQQIAESISNDLKLLRKN